MIHSILYWAANFDKMVEVIKFVLERGPAYGYNLNMKKSIYLMAPTAMKLSEHEIKRKIQVLNDLGVPTQNIKVHPDCQLNVSSVLADERRAEWGIKILGAYVGTDEYVVNALRCKMVSIRKLTQTMLYYPNVQARYYLHRFCYNAKVNYWMRAQFPKHVAPFVQDFKEQQLINTNTTNANTILHTLS